MLDPPPKERILQCLDKLESGDLSAWWQLNKVMTLKPDSQYYDNEFELDLTQLPGWKEADETTRSRIIESAKKYAKAQDYIDYSWIGTNTVNRPALAGCRALHLLLTENLDYLEKLPLEAWQRWAPVIIAGTNSNQHEASYLELVRYAYLNAPKNLINTLMTLIDQENQQHDYLFVIDKLDKCWNNRLKLALLEKAKDSSLKPKCVGELLDKLLKQGLTEVEDFAKSLITFPQKTTVKEREKALIASRVLVENSNPSSWSFIWAIIVQQDSLFGHEILELVAQRNVHGIQLNLNETQLADLYIWLVHGYPYSEDPDHSNAMEFARTARDGIARLRDGVLSQLKERGTLEACTEVERLIQELPDITWLGITLIDAHAIMRRKTWQSMSPEDLIQFLTSNEPSNSDLSNQIDGIDQRTKKMEDEPKIVNRISFSNSPNSSINAPVGTSGVTNSNVTNANFNDKKGGNWGNWLAVIAVIVAVVGLPLSMSVSGAFNEEFKELFNRIFSSKVEQKPVPKSE